MAQTLTEGINLLGIGVIRNSLNYTAHKIMKRLTILAILILSGCADSVAPEQISSIDPVGFWYGLWHGMILPFAWFVSLFDSDVAVYAVYNNGGWYDFGFVMGVGGLFGGTTESKKR